MPRDVQIVFRGPPRPLLERMQHIDGLGEAGDVEHSMLKLRVNADFADTRSDDCHRLPVQWVEALLDPPELNARQSPGGPWEGPHVPARRTEPLEQAIRHGSIYKF